MQCRAIGFFSVRGDEGVYVESLEFPGCYAAASYGYLPVDEIDTQTIIGRVFDLPVTRDEIVERLDDCF